MGILQQGELDQFNRFVAFFFISIVLVCGMVLTNVVSLDEQMSMGV